MSDLVPSDVPDDEPRSTIPDAVVTVVEPKTADSAEKAVEVEKPSEPRDAAAESADAMAVNLRKAQEQLKHTQTKLATETAARQDAEQKATEAQSRISLEVQNNISANRTAAKNAKEAAQAELDKNKKLAAEMQAEGKFDEAEDARLKAFEAKQKINGVEKYLSDLEASIARLEEEAGEPAKPQDDDTGKVDSVTGTKFTHSTHEWISKHKDNWADQDFRVACDAASRSLKRKGIAVDTPEYFDGIEQYLQREGYLEAQQDEAPAEEDLKPVKVEAKPTVKKPVAVSGAPSRAVAGTPGAQGKKVEISGIEREIARSLVESLPEVYGRDANPDQIYARNKLAIQNEKGE